MNMKSPLFTQYNFSKTSFVVTCCVLSLAPVRGIQRGRNGDVGHDQLVIVKHLAQIVVETLGAPIVESRRRQQNCYKPNADYDEQSVSAIELARPRVYYEHPSVHGDHHDTERDDKRDYYLYGVQKFAPEVARRPIGKDECDQKRRSTYGDEQQIGECEIQHECIAYIAQFYVEEDQVDDEHVAEKAQPDHERLYDDYEAEQSALDFLRLVAFLVVVRGVQVVSRHFLFV